jgi:Phage integrase SAM-like domain
VGNRPAANLHLQPKNGGWRARVLVPVELQEKIGKKLFFTPVWRVSRDEAAALAYPEVRKFETLIERAKCGMAYVEAVEMEAQGPLKPMVFPTIRGISTVASESTTFTAMIEEWARKNRIDNPQTKQKVEGHFKRLAEFLGHDNGADVTSPDIVRFEKHLATTPDPRTGKLRHPNTPLTYLSSFSAVFTVAVQQFLIDTNPMDKVAVGSKIESQRQPYSVEQVTMILNRAQHAKATIFFCRYSQKPTPGAG